MRGVRRLPGLGVISRRQLLGLNPTELPRLVRRLILETTPGLVELDGPADEGVYSGGWDTVARAASTTPWVPAGLSLWEMAVRKDGANAKADDDYEKRRQTPDGSPTTSATYVQLIANTWDGRSDWARQRSAEGRWQEVRGYGVDKLQAWLEAAPVTYAWLAAQLGFHPYGYRSHDQWWDAWASQTDPCLTPSVVLSGRSEEAKSLGEHLRGAPRVTTVSGASVDEICAFVLAALAEHSDLLEGRRLLARTALVDRAESWRELLGQSSPLVLVPDRHRMSQERPASSPHHVVVPVVQDLSRRADIVLPRLDSAAVADALREVGVTDEDRAERLGYLARRSLQTLRRALAPNPELFTPEWAQSPAPRECRAALLAGSWADEHLGDQAILGELGGGPYDPLQEDLNKTDNSPLLHLNEGGFIYTSFTRPLKSRWERQELVCLVARLRLSASTRKPLSLNMVGFRVPCRSLEQLQVQHTLAVAE